MINVHYPGINKKESTTAYFMIRAFRRFPDLRALYLQWLVAPPLTIKQMQYQAEAILVLTEFPEFHTSRIPLPHLST